MLAIADLMSATMVRRLMHSWNEPDDIPEQKQLNGLRELWRLQLRAAQLVEDDRAIARGLSILGLVERRRDAAQGVELHERALRVAEQSGDLRSKFISHADLGDLERSRQNTEAAIRHFEEALECARAFGDTEHETSIIAMLESLPIRVPVTGASLDKLRDDFRRAIDGLREIRSRISDTDVLWLAQEFVAALAGSTRRGGFVQETAQSVAARESGLAAQFELVIEQAYRTVYSLQGRSVRTGPALATVLQGAGWHAATSNLLRILVVGDGASPLTEIGFEFLQEPVVDPRGLLTFGIRLETLDNLPDPFFLEIWNTAPDPPERLSTTGIAGQDRELLTSTLGLQVQALVVGRFAAVSTSESQSSGGDATDVEAALSDEPIVDFGVWVERRRRILRLKQDDLAERAGSSIPEIVAIEHGESTPSEQLARSLAAAMELSEGHVDTFVKCARREIPVDRLPHPSALDNTPNQILQGPRAPQLEMLEVPHSALLLKISWPPRPDHESLNP